MEGCTNQALARELCRAHYYRWKKHGDVLADVPVAAGHPGLRSDRTCSVPGCDSPHNSRGWCLRHYLRWKDYGDPEAPLRRARNGGGYRGISNQGYVVWKFGRTTILEHRVRMEEKLGRPLLPNENVHHKNGVKTDNRPENLEVWVKVQPCGQRIEDLVAFVVEHYPAEVAAAQALAVTG